MHRKIPIDRKWMDNTGGLPVRLPLPRVTQCPPGMVMGANGCVVNQIDPFPPTKGCPPGMTIGPNGACGVAAIDPVHVAYTPPFCDGNSGIPCPTTGFLGVQRPSDAPDLRPGLFGLADLLAPGHVPAGQRIHWEAQVSCGLTGSPPSWDNFVQSLAPALVNASGSFTASIWPGYSNLVVEATTGFERDSIDNIVSDLTSSAEASGCKVNSSTPLTIVTGFTGTQGSTTGGSTPGPCDNKSGVDWVSCQLGVNPSTAIAGGIGIGTIILIFGIGVMLIALKR